MGVHVVQEIVSKCLRNLGAGPEWDDWQLIGDGGLCVRAFGCLAGLVTDLRASQEWRGDIWLTSANVHDGPHACMAVQAHLQPPQWPVTTVQRSKYGVFLYPDPCDYHPTTGLVSGVPSFVLVDTVFNTGAHVREAYSMIASWTTARLARVLCLAVIYNNSDPHEGSLTFDSQNPHVPVVAVVERRRDIVPPQPGPIQIADHQPAFPVRHRP
jgi:hypothetical protein